MKRGYIDFRDQIARNKFKSYLLMVGILIILVLLGFFISYGFYRDSILSIMIAIIIFSLTYNLILYYNSDKIALKIVNAQIAERSKYSDYYRLVEGLTISSGLPLPSLYVMKSENINAFATGRNPKNSSLCVTTGALEKLDKRELEGVLAHELGHIGSYDIRFMTLVTVMVGMISIISEIFLRSLWFRGKDTNENSNVIFILIGIVLAILAPIAVNLIQLSISRKAEYSADATAVKFTRNPSGLIGALEKIKKYSEYEKQIPRAVTPLFFTSPLKNALSTHPPLEKRIEALKRM